MAGTRARGPTPEPTRLGHHLAVVSGVLLLLGSVGLAPHVWDRIHVAAREAPFLLESVHVRGLDRLPVAEIRAVLGLTAGTPLLDLDVAALEARLELHPWITDATVIRDPSGGLRIQVREHVPLAVTLAGEPALPYDVNARGVAFAPASQDDLQRLVAVAVEPPAVVGEPDARLREALRLSASLRDRGLEVPRQVRLGLLQREQSAEVRLRGFAPAVWIERSRSGEQLDRLATLLTSSLAATSNAQVIDLRFEHRAVLWNGP